MSICLFIHVREVCTRLILYPPDTDCPSNTESCGPKYSTATRPQTTTSHVDCRMLRNKDGMCFHRDTARGFGSISARNTLRAKAPTEGTENTCRDFTRSNKKRLTHVRALHVSHSNCVCGQDTCNGEPGVGTVVQLLTVEQDCPVTGS